MARKRNQGSNWIRKDKRLAIYLRDDCRCAYCGRDAAMGAILTLDHIVACENGGTNAATNLITSCRSCNSSKQDLPLDEWFAILDERGFDSCAVKAKMERNRKVKLTPIRRTAKCILASLDTTDFDTMGHIAYEAK